jgi:hypothetical protein
MPLANQVGTVTARLTGILRHNGVMAGSQGVSCFFVFFLVSLHLILICLSIPVQIAFFFHLVEADVTRFVWIKKHQQHQQLK